MLTLQKHTFKGSQINFNQLFFLTKANIANPEPDILFISYMFSMVR